jgi:glycosyltransferase involved in cell wall biosynthesis
LERPLICETLEKLTRFGIGNCQNKGKLKKLLYDGSAFPIPISDRAMIDHTVGYAIPDAGCCVRSMISIIIPCYNASPTLRTTVASALSQAYQSKEVIIIDDGSTDSSADIINSYGNTIVAHTQPNRGVSAARNQGTMLAQGEYIQYLDADDLLAPDTLTKRVEALEITGADIAYTDWQQFTMAGDESVRQGKVIALPLDSLGSDAEAACASSTFWAPPAALLYRKKVVDRIGGWNPRLPVIQDARFIFDAARLGARFTRVEGVGALYRVSDDSLSRRSPARFVRDCFVNATEIEAIWRSGGQLTEGRRRELNRIWSYLATATFRANLPEFGEACRHLRSVSGQPHVDMRLRSLLSSIVGQSAVWAVEQRLRKLLRPIRWLSGYAAERRSHQIPSL